jgi:MYXO-CTERM domain-containing protein
MNARAAYLAWLRINAPEVWTAAMRKVAGKARGLGGLSDDLIARMSRPSTGFGFFGDDTSDLPTITVTADAYPTTVDPSLALDPTALDPVDFTVLQQQANAPVPLLPTPDATTAPAQPAASSSGIFASIINAVASVTTAGMAANAQSGLLRLNTQRASQGLPPVNAAGVPIATSFLSPSSNPTIARLEATIAGAGSSPILWIGALALAGLFLLRKKA